MNEDPILRIARLLLKRTRTGDVQWVPTDDEQAFLCSTKDSSVVVRTVLDSDGDENVVLSLLNARGQEVGELRSTWDQEESDEAWPRYRPGANNKLLQDLAEGARRNALQVDQVVEGLLKELGGDQS